MKLNAERIRERLEEIGITQTELSRRAGVKWYNLSKYMAGRVCPRKVLMNLADCLDVDYLEIAKFNTY